MRRRLSYCIVLVALPVSAIAQFSGYGSISYGSDSNPLRNFAEIHDNLTQGYLELHLLHEHERSSLDAAYVGGLMLFSDLQERNFYQHALSLRQSLRLGEADGKPRSEPRPTTDVEDEADSLTTDDSATVADSTGSILSLKLAVSARHDKAAYSDFDNYRVGFDPDYRWESNDGITVRALNELGYRNYLHLSELNNVTDALTITVDHTPHPAWTYGAFVGGGIKHYTVSTYDTTIFEPARTFMTKSSGKGKGGALLRVPSTKKILVNPQASTTYTIAAGLQARAAWPTGSLQTVVRYRVNPGPANRYLAQHANATLLNQDIYDESFGVTGPDVVLELKQALFFGIHVGIDARAQRWDFGVPAFTLSGEHVGTDRRDDRVGVTIGVSRFFAIAGDFGCDVGLEGLILRNRSNDEYNDYAASSVMLQIGIGF
jgi:hypothetical protein